MPFSVFDLAFRIWKISSWNSRLMLLEISIESILWISAKKSSRFIEFVRCKFFITKWRSCLQDLNTFRIVSVGRIPENSISFISGAIGRTSSTILFIKFCFASSISSTEIWFYLFFFIVYVLTNIWWFLKGSKYSKVLGLCREENDYKDSLYF